MHHTKSDRTASLYPATDGARLLGHVHLLAIVRCVLTSSSTASACVCPGREASKREQAVRPTSNHPGTAPSHHALDSVYLGSPGIRSAHCLVLEQFTVPSPTAVVLAAAIQPYGDHGSQPVPVHWIVPKGGVTRVVRPRTRGWRACGPFGNWSHLRCMTPPPAFNGGARSWPPERTAPCTGKRCCFSAFECLCRPCCVHATIPGPAYGTGYSQG
jgi:hypothetical protein